MIRCFLAIDLSSEVKEYIRKAQRRWQGINCKVKWVEPVNCHLTLKFLGDVDRSSLNGLARGLEEAVSAFGSFELSLSAPGVFPSPLRPRVLWLGMKGDLDRLSALWETMEVFLETIGFEPEGKGFVPHVTVGRVKRCPKEADISMFLKDSPPSLRIVVDSFTLFQSVLTPKGPVYTKLRDFKLL